MKARILKHVVAVSLLVCATLLLTFPAFAVVPTNDDIKNMVTRGKAYLFAQQTPATYNADTGAYISGGKFSGSYPVSATGFAVAALLETGVLKTDQHIIDGINYLRSVLGDGTSGYDDVYETNIALIALATYNDPADLTRITNLVTLMESWQCSDGGWGYGLGGGCGGDMSHTQFGVMGLWYGYRYLGKTFDSDAPTQAIKNKLFRYLQTSYTSSNGQFGYTPGSTSYPTSTSSGLWSLGMIGMIQDLAGHPDAATPTGATMTTGAVGWFNNNYAFGSSSTWLGSSSDYYFVYGMAKALTIALGDTGKVGDHAWVEDLKNVLYNQRIDISETQTRWHDTYWMRNYGDTFGTALVLLSLSFADVNQPVPSRILAQDTGLDNDIKGSVVIHTTGGVLIEPVRANPADPASAALPFRSSTTGEGLSKEVTTYLPLGAFRFKLKPVPVGGTAEFTINLPAGALDPNNKKSFIDKNGNLKKGLDWFKLDNGKWKGNKKIPMVLDKTAGTITVTLTDGGLGDDDKTVNGEITDPAAPGYDPFVDLTLADALKTLKIAVGIDPVTADALLSYDIAPVVNGEVLPDGKVDLFDAMMILRKSVGLPVTPTGGV